METELKLRLSAPELPRLLTHPLLATGADMQRCEQGAAGDGTLETGSIDP